MNALHFWHHVNGSVAKSHEAKVKCSTKNMQYIWVTQ